MKRKKEPDNSYHFPFWFTLIGWLIEMLVFGGLGMAQRIYPSTLLYSLGLLTIGWWTGMLAYSLLAYLYFQDKNKKR